MKQSKVTYVLQPVTYSLIRLHGLLLI